MASNQTASFGLGKQSAKGTAATTFVRGRLTSSRATPEWMEDQPEQEHTGVHERATAQQSLPQRIGYRIPLQASFRLYPYMIGHALLMAGFKVSTTANSPETGVYTHLFTLADRDEYLWGSVIRGLGEGAARYTRVIKDSRFGSLSLESSRQNGLVVNLGDGVGILDAEAAGTETVTAEPDYRLNPATGVFTLTSSDVTANSLGTPQGSLFTVNNPLGQDEMELHSYVLADLVQDGLTLNGEHRGLIWGETLFQELLYAGGASPSGDALLLPSANITQKFESVADIPTTSTKYSFQIALTGARLRMQPYDTAGSGKLKYTMTYSVPDVAASSPVTITLINDHASY